MPFLNVASYSERQQRAVQRILDQLARSNLRNETQYARLRKSARKPYQGCLSIFLPSPQQPDPPPQGPGTFTAWSYSLSQGGVGFVTPNDFDEQVIVVGIHLPNGSTRWLRGDVVRKRQFPGEEFFDYGVAFHAARAQAEQDKPALAASSA
jgi:hypothetical protein